MSAHQMSPLTAVRGEKKFKKKAKDAILTGLFCSFYLRNSLLEKFLVLKELIKGFYEGVENF